MKSNSLPPGPRDRFPGDMLLSSLRAPADFLSRTVLRHGDVTHIKIGPHAFFPFTHPRHVKQVLITQNRNFVKGPAHKQIKYVLGEGLLTSEGDFHLRMRRLIQPLFHRNHLASHTDAIRRLAERTGGRWRAGQTIDINHEMWDLNLRVIARTLFNSTVEEEADDISAALAELTRLFNPLLLLFADRLIRVPNPMVRQYEAARTRLDENIYRAGGHTGELPALLHAAQFDQAGREIISEKQIRDESLTVFIAGLGTMAYALSRTWYLLSQNPDAEEKFHEELDRVLGGRPPTSQDIARLEYTRRVLAESMRIYPPSWIMDRAPVTDFQVEGYCIPAGSTMVLSQWVTHRDARWYADPLRFEPDRWLPERARDLPDCAYFPFGAGPRLCIGEPLAWMSGILILAVLGQRWKLRLAPGHRLDLEPHFSWNPRDVLYMEPEPRTPPTTA